MARWYRVMKAHAGVAYSSRAVKNTGPNPAGGKEKPKAQGRMTSGARTDLAYRKANLKKEELSDWRKDILSEEGYDRMRDRKLEMYGSGYRSAGSRRGIARSGGIIQNQCLRRRRMVLPLWTL